jgi:HD-GYP domain-containing protein (c-di-GMP phosphodiesterase class II)
MNERDAIVLGALLHDIGKLAMFPFIRELKLPLNHIQDIH